MRLRGFLAAIVVWFMIFPCWAQDAEQLPEKVETTVEQPSGTPAAKKATKPEKPESDTLAGVDVLLNNKMLFDPVPGSWARYRLEEKIQQQSREILVGIGPRRGAIAKNSYWIEIITTSKSGTEVKIGVLYRIDKTGRHEVDRLVVKMGDHPAVELPDSSTEYSLTREKPVRYAQLGMEKVEVPAGRFDAERGRFRYTEDEVMEVWTSKDVPPFGIVRAMSITYDLQLMEYGSDFEPMELGEPMILKSPEPFNANKP